LVSNSVNDYTDYMKKTRLILFSVASAAAIIYSCKSEFLERQPVAALDEKAVATRAGVEGLLIGAYAMLDGQSTGAGIFAMSWASSGMNWIYGSVGADESHKGSEAGDQPEINQIERHEPTPTNGYFDTKWYALYEGIARANTTLRIMAVATDISADDVKRITGEARFLRAITTSRQKKCGTRCLMLMKQKVTTDPANFKLGNEADIWPQITADLQFAYDNLPATMNAKGRANKWAAGAMLGKALLFQKKFAEARTLLDAVYTQGVNAQGQKYALLTAYQDNFNAETKNSTESVFAIQYSVNDGAPDAANGGWGEVLNYPHNSGPGGCCGFFQPTQDLVNSYQVDAVTGLPRLGNHNSVEVPSDMGIPASSVWSATGDYKKDGFVSAFEASSPNRERVYKALQDNKGVNPLTSPNTWQLVWVEPNDVAVDSRLDWSVGRRGIPYLDHGNHPGQAWIRDQPNGGPTARKRTCFMPARKAT
jgi:hypothetical protein